MVDLVTFGETMLRLSPPRNQRIETADQYDVHVAGSESNVAVAAGRLGLETAWLSKLPASPAGRKVANEIRGHDVDIGVVWDDSDSRRQGTYYLEQGETPRGNSVIYDRAGASVTTTEFDELDTDRVASATAFHTSGITPALSDTLESTTADILEFAQAQGVTTSLDVNYRSKLWTPAEAEAVLTDLFEHVDLLLIARRDAETVLGIEGGPLQVAETVTERYGFETTVVTHGAKGAVAATADATHDQRAFEATDAHPVGSGDSFVGGFLSQYVADEPIPDALAWGSATAALKRSVPGDIAVVSPDEVRAVIAGETIDIDR